MRKHSERSQWARPKSLYTCLLTNVFRFSFLLQESLACGRLLFPNVPLGSRSRCVCPLITRMAGYHMAPVHLSATIATPRKYNWINEIGFCWAWDPIVRNRFSIEHEDRRNINQLNSITADWTRSVDKCQALHSDRLKQPLHVEQWFLIS